MLVRRISAADYSKYNKLAKKYGTVFNTTNWLKIFGEKAQIYGIYDKGDNLIGGFSTYRARKFGLIVCRNCPFTQVVGPFLIIEAKNPVAIMTIWKKALALMAESIESLSADIISISLNKNIVDTQPFIWKKFKVIVRYTYVLDLRKSIEDIQSEMSAKRRNDIKKAIKDKLAVKQSCDLEIVKSLILKTFSRQQMKADRYHLDKVLFEFANKDNSFSFVTFVDDNPIATAFCIYDKDTAYYILGGYDYKGKHHGAGALTIWESIKYAKGLGLKYFDFEGSIVPQIERYFRGFGGQLTPLYRINKAKLPLEILLKFFKRELF